MNLFGYLSVLVVPFKTNMIAKRVRDNPDDEELERRLIEYNKGLSSGRIDIEHTFGLLKVCFMDLLFQNLWNFFKDVGELLDKITLLFKGKNNSKFDQKTIVYITFRLNSPFSNQDTGVEA